MSCMSRATRQIPTSIDICDWCEEAMNKYDVQDGMFHEPTTASIVNGYISHPTSDKDVNKFYFLWRRREEQKPDVRYDFHTRCFDEMVKKALKDKQS